MTNTQTIKATLNSTTALLNTEGPALEAQLLLQHALNVNRAWLIAHENDALEANIHAAYMTLISRRSNGEPIAYILGTREFYGLNLKVTPATLIPRPDTETLVETALAKIPQNNNTSSPSFRRKSESSGIEPLEEKTLDSDFRRNDALKVLDLGTGTGAIALAIAKHRPNALVTAVDASQAALDVAIENAKNLEITNINFMLSDWFASLNNEKFDVIVSNPPYIEENDAHLKQGDLPWEPISALVAGQDGLSDIRTIILQSKNHLHPHGYLALEHGYNQAESVATLLKSAGFTDVETIKDLGDNNRVTLGCYL
ncbi:MAG: peptide chain release factor N(5)-glutamine methyltransferase [Methylotenera sp.]